MSELRKMVPGKGDVLVAEWDSEVKETVDLTEAEFDRMMGEDGQRLAYATDEDGENTAIKEFDPGAKTITVVPLGVGG